MTTGNAWVVLCGDERRIAYTPESFLGAIEELSSGGVIRAVSVAADASGVVRLGYDHQGATTECPLSPPALDTRMLASIIPIKSGSTH